MSLLLLSTKSFQDVIGVLKWAVEHTIIAFGDVNQTGETELDIQIGYFFRIEATSTTVTIYTTKSIASYIGLENTLPDGHLSEHVKIIHSFLPPVQKADFDPLKKDGEGRDIFDKIAPLIN